MDPSQLSPAGQTLWTRTTINEPKLDLSELDQTVAGLAGISLDSYPAEVLTLIFPQDMSKKDFQSISQVSKRWNELVHQPQVLAGIIHRANFQIPLDTLLLFLNSSGSFVRSLNFHRLLSDWDRSRLTSEQLQQIFMACPRLESVFFYSIPCLSGEILLNCFNGAVCNSITQIGIFGGQKLEITRIGVLGGIMEESDLQTENNYHAVIPRLKQFCPKLETIFIELLPPMFFSTNLLWLKSGKDYFEFIKLKNTLIKEFKEASLPVHFAEMILPDFLQKLSHERRLEFFKEEVSPFRLFMDGTFEFLNAGRGPEAMSQEHEKFSKLLQDFFELPGDSQNRLLALMPAPGPRIHSDSIFRKIIKMINSGKTLRYIADSLERM